MEEDGKESWKMRRNAANNVWSGYNADKPSFVIAVPPQLSIFHTQIQKVNFIHCAYNSLFVYYVLYYAQPPTFIF